MNQAEITMRLSSYLGVDIDTLNLDAIRNFLLLWNQFEAKLFNCSFSTPDAISKSGMIKIDNDIMVNTLHYFQQRYLSEGKINTQFLQLGFRHNDNQPLVEDVLFGNNKNNSDIIAAIIIIISRYRNNLFHGIKNVRLSSSQQTNFKYANTFLLTCLESNAK